MANDRPRQLTSTVLMVRPARFGFNSETQETNPFQHESPRRAAAEATQSAAAHEHDAFAGALREAGVTVTVVDDTAEPEKPDAVFPNNWFSTHEDGTLVLYPLLAKNRRLERRPDEVRRVAETLELEIGHTLDLTPQEADGRFLEGTGSVVLDRRLGVAYACRSPRTCPELVEELARELGYRAVVFDGRDAEGRSVYHTNVLLSIGEGFAVVCGSAIEDPARRTAVLGELAQGREVIEIERRQMGAFAGNVLQLARRAGGSVIAMSSRAHESFGRTQLAALRRHGEIVHRPLETIETLGGGSARCLLAELFLPRAGEERGRSA